MPLKLNLRRDERFVINGAVIAPVEKSCSIVVLNKAIILRESSILTPEKATSPARLIHLAIQNLYLDSERRDEHQRDFLRRFLEFGRAVPSALALLDVVRRAVNAGHYYHAIVALRPVLELEAKLLGGSR